MTTDQALELLIELKVIGKDQAEEGRAILEKYKDTTTEAAGELGKLNQQEEEGAGHAEKLHINHRVLHMIMHMIGHETAPELGRAMTGALYGPIGIAIALGAALEFVKKKYDEIAEAAKKAKEDQEAIDLKKFQDQVTALTTAADEANRYATELANADTNLKQLSDDEKLAQTTLKEQGKSRVEVLKEAERAILANIEAQKKHEEELRKKEHITVGVDEMNDRYAKREAAIKETYASKISEAERDNQRNQLDLEKQQVAARQANADALRQKADEAQKAYNQSLQDTSVSQDEDRVKKLTDIVAKTQPTTPAMLQSLGLPADSKYDPLGALKEQLQSAREQLAADRKHADDLKNAKDEMLNAYKENAAAVRAQTQTIREQQSAFDIQGNTVDQINDIKKRMDNPGP